LIARGADPETKAVMRHRGSDYDAIWGRLGDVAGTGVRGTRITRAPGRAAAPPMRLRRKCSPLLARGRPND
jgi:hypothetical protein